MVGSGAGLPIVIRRTQLLPLSAVAVWMYIPTLVSQSGQVAEYAGRVEKSASTQANKREPSQRILPMSQPAVDTIVLCG